MNYEPKKIDDRRMCTGKCRLSYPHLFEVYAESGKYQVQLIIPKSDKQTVDMIMEMERDTIKRGIAEKWGSKEPKDLATALKDGDDIADERPELAGCYYLTAKTTRKPCVVARDRSLITDEFEVYAGCYARATIAFFAYAVSGNRGVSCLLNNIQKLEDGEAFGGGVGNLTGDFDDIMPEDDCLS